MPLQNTSFFQLGDGNPSELVVTAKPAHAAYTAAATLTPADLAGGAVTYAGAGANLTLPLATDLDAAFPNLPAGASFEFSVAATGAGTATVVTNTGWTTTGTLTVATTTATRFRVRKLAAGSYSLLQVA
jgi:hypothetical protein